MWVLEFLAGMFLAYYIISPRLRRKVNGFIIWFVGSPNKQPPVRKKRAKTAAILAKAKPVELGASNGNVQVGDEEIEKWLSKNKDLRDANSR